MKPDLKKLIVYNEIIYDDEIEFCNDIAEFFDGFESFEDAWNNCNHGIWMLWIADKVGVDIRILTKAKAMCALTVRHLMRDERSVRACEIALKFADSEATLEDLNAAAKAACEVVDESRTEYQSHRDTFRREFYMAAYAAYTTAEHRVYSSAAWTGNAVYSANTCEVCEVPQMPTEATFYKMSSCNGNKVAEICRELLKEGVIEKIKNICK